MAIELDLRGEVKSILKSAWTERDGTVVPEAADLKLTNDAVKLDAAVLYADLSASTVLVNSHTPAFAAEIYKCYLHCAAKIVRDEGGVVTAYDGDRVMGVFLGSAKNTSAARAALKINYARVKVINPAILEQYPSSNYSVNHTVGVDASPLFVARTGVRGANDLVWVGRAANYAAKLSALAPEFATVITDAVYQNIHASVKATDGQSMWAEATWTAQGNLKIWRSTWTWPC